VHSPRDPLLASGIKLTPDAHDFGRRVTASTSGLFGDLSGLRPARPHATPGRAVRDGPDLFGGRPGIDSGPRRLRAAVPRSAFWSLWPDAAARLSAGLPSRGCPCRAPRRRSIAPLRRGVPPSGGSGTRSSAPSGVRYPLRSPVQDWKALRPNSPTISEFSRSKKSAPIRVDTAESALSRFVREKLRSNSRAS
jgi:hypothetical protein